MLWPYNKLIVAKTTIWMPSRAIGMANKAHIVMSKWKFLVWNQIAPSHYSCSSRVLGNFLLRLEYACPWAVVALNLTVLSTGSPETNLSLEEGVRQRN